MKISAKWGFRFAWSLLAFFLYSSAWGSAGGSDVEVGFLVEPAGVIEPGTEGVLHVTAINHGDVTVEPWMTFSKQLDDADYFLDFFGDADTAPCTYAYYTLDGSPGNPSFDGIQLLPGVLASEQSVTCRVKFRVGLEASGAVQVRVSALPGFDDGIDPDYSNNSIRTAIMEGLNNALSPADLRDFWSVRRFDARKFRSQRVSAALSPCYRRNSPVVGKNRLRAIHRFDSANNVITCAAFFARPR